MMTKPVSILGVDDRPENLLALEAVLETLEITVVKAYSGQEALEYILKEEFALILMDVQMPNMDGFETASLMRGNKKTEHIPIIFVTAISKEQKHVFKGYDSGAVDYLFKPIDPNVLRSKVKVFIELFRQKETLKMKAKELEKANRHILKQQQILKASEVRFKTAFDQSFQFMAILDPEGRVLELNALALKLCGAVHKEVVGQYLWDVWWLGTTDESLVLKTVVERAVAGELTNDEACFYDEDRQRHLFLRTVSPVRNDVDDIIYIAVQGQDITKRKNVEQEKRRLEHQLRQAQKMEAIGTLAGGIAHDFNNILGIILGYADMAIRRKSGNVHIDRYLNKILTAANKAKDLVKQILTFSRQAEIERIPFKPATIIIEAIKLLRASIPSTIEIHHDIDLECGLILADPTQFHQIMINLCTNAFHAMETSGGTLTLTLDDAEIRDEVFCSGVDIKPGNFIRLTVRDTGPGMSPEEKEKIFDPYFTTKEVGKGTGMGLSIVHGIVKSYGGFIEVDTEPAKGSAFHVHFPVVDAAEDETKQEIAAFPVGRETILLVDDDEVLLEMTKSMLEMLGYKVTSNKESLTALELFREHSQEYDLAITNQIMPKMTGTELSKKMLEIRPGFPIILCTGYSTHLSRESVKEMGINDLAFKPLVIDDISQLIRNTLDGKSGGEK